jgi:hypothetical protein
MKPSTLCVRRRAVQIFVLSIVPYQKLMTPIWACEPNPPAKLDRARAVLPFIVVAKELAFEKLPPAAVAVACAVPPSIAIEVAVALAIPLGIPPGTIFHLCCSIVSPVAAPTQSPSGGYCHMTARRLRSRMSVRPALDSCCGASGISLCAIGRAGQIPLPWL